MYVHIEKLSDEEQKKLYMGLKKEELVAMLIQANKHLDILTEAYQYNKNG